MARSDPALPLRVPARARQEPAPRGDDGRPRLRLVVTKGRLGVELEQPISLGLIRVLGLSQVFPGVRFPVDLSQGSIAFRNRRGVLEQLKLALDTAPLTQRLRDACADLLAPGRPAQVLVAPLADGWTVGVGVEERALCFDVVVAPLEADLRLLVCDARCLGIGEPAHALALRALIRMCKPFAKLHGGVVMIESAARSVARALVPLGGMRAPAVEQWCWQGLELAVEGVRIAGGSDLTPGQLSERAVRLLELAELCVSADAALLSGDREQARRGYLAALAEAPRHPELSYRLADLDRAAGERHEAALVTLGDAAAAVDGGALGATLLEAIGDRQGASYAWRRAAEREPFGWLAALCWLRLAALSESDAGPALSEALTRAPDMAAARWRRLRAELRAGRLIQARADAQQLEAAASGRERFEVMRRAGELFFEERALDDAARCFERALRYQPASVAAVAGLAEALAALGQGRRALDLFARAVQLAERGKQPEHAVVLKLARALVEVADDRPAAIARVRRIPALVTESFEARSLEARWRADLGDLAGAGVALDELARAVEVALAPLVDGTPEGPFADAWGAPPAHQLPAAEPLPRDQVRAQIGRMLLEGARLQELDRGDNAAARRLLTLAVRVWPRSPAVQRAFRRLARHAPDAVMFGDPPHQDDPDAQPSPIASNADSGATAATHQPHPFVALELDDERVSSADVAQEQLAEQLAIQLRADPHNAPLARRLMELLEQLGQDHELLALLAARLEEAPAAEQNELRARRRAVLGRLAAAATAAGRPLEASVYHELLAQDDDSA